MPLKLYRRGKVWHYRGTVANRRLRGSTGAQDKAIAQRIAAEVENRAWRSHLDGPATHVTMAQAAIAYREAGKATRFLEEIEDHWKDTPIREITGEAVRLSARKIYPHVSPATWNRQVLTPTKAIINYAAELGWCSPIRIRKFDHDPAQKAPATLEWVNAFATQATKDRLPHLAALCLFMFGTAARISEALRLQWKDVDLSKGTARLYGFKPKPWARIAHMPPRVVAALANIPSNRDPENTVFGYAERSSAAKVWANVAKRAKIANLSPHCCRHGFATTMLRAGYDVATIAKRGGWKDAATVLRTYSHALDDVTVTDAIFGTDLAQNESAPNISDRKERRISK